MKKTNRTRSRGKNGATLSEARTGRKGDPRREKRGKSVGKLDEKGGVKSVGRDAILQSPSNGISLKTYGTK